MVARRLLAAVHVTVAIIALPAVSMRPTTFVVLRLVIACVGPLNALCTCWPATIAFELAGCSIWRYVSVMSADDNETDIQRQKLHATVIFLVRCLDDPK